MVVPTLWQRRRQVAESLRQQGLRVRAAGKYKATTNANHTLPVAQNLLQQDFSTQRPNQVWVGYIATDGGWLYLALVLDLLSHKMVVLSMPDRMTATLVCNTLRIALCGREMPREVVMHAGRCTSTVRGNIAHCLTCMVWRPA